MPIHILCSASPKGQFQLDVKHILEEIGYVVLSLTDLKQNAAIHMVLVWPETHIAEVESSLKNKNILTKGLPYLFLNPPPTIVSHPEAGIWVLQEQDNALHVAYQVEKMVGLPPVLKEEPPSIVDPSAQEEMDKLKFEVESLKGQVNLETQKRSVLEDQRQNLQHSLVEKARELEKSSQLLKEKDQALVQERSRKEEVRQLAQKLLEATQ